jgi:hypothetical protein
VRRRSCSVDGCFKYARKKGLCKAHAKEKIKT